MKPVIIDFQRDAFMTSMLRGNAGCYSLRHLDTSGGVLRPFPKHVSDASAIANRMRNFCVGSRLTDNDVVFAISQEPGNDNQIQFATDFNNDDTPTWTNPGSSSQVNASAIFPNTFAYYKNYAYITKQAGGLDRFGDLTGAAVWALGYQTITLPVDVAPVHHKLDDSMYFFGENTVYRLNGTTWDGSVLSLPTTHKVAAACEYSNFLAIFMQSKSSSQPNFVAIWDRNSSLTTLADRPQCGWGYAKGMGTVNGELVIAYDNSASGYSLGQTKFFVKVYRGGVFTELNTINGTTADALRTPSYFCDGEHLYVLAGLSFADADGLSTTDFTGIWRVDNSGRVELCNYDSSFMPARFSKLGNIYYLFSLTGETTCNRTTKGVSTTDYSLPGIFETRFYDDGDSSYTKKLKSVSVGFDPLLSGGSVSLYYRVAGTAAYTLIKTVSTTGATRLSANVDNSGAKLPRYKRIQFYLKIVGKTTVTDMRYTPDAIPNDISN